MDLFIHPRTHPCMDSSIHPRTSFIHPGIPFIHIYLPSSLHPATSSSPYPTIHLTLHLQFSVPPSPCVYFPTSSPASPPPMSIPSSVFMVDGSIILSHYPSDLPFFFLLPSISSSHYPDIPPFPSPHTTIHLSISQSTFSPQPPFSFSPYLPQTSWRSLVSFSS